MGISVDKIKILVVDDDFIVRNVISDLLEASEKYEPIQAENGQDALDKLAANPDVRMIISDHHMPVMDGLTLLKTVRSGGSTIPFLVLSGTADPMVGIGVAFQGGTAYIMKDEFDDRLLPAIERAIAL